ncbi:MAG: hypothetical protein QG551_54 [Patescibacteria group bacterium]|jgi:uncharacterized protein (DUF305 family)|nr:hypothetical protein [Patescibacteria group bacterium]
MENQKLINIVGVVGLVLVVAVLFFNKNDVDHDSHMMLDGQTMQNDEINGMHNNMTIENDEQFLNAMIPHHQEAVSSASEVLARGGSFPEIKTLAENIIRSQSLEIDQMKGWYEFWFQKPFMNHSTYIPMMRELSGLSGAELDKAFLEDMIMHHDSAVMMAEQAKIVGREEIKKMSGDIITAQTKEIEMMKEWLETKFK